jgi:hypothetical protein
MQRLYKRRGCRQRATASAVKRLGGSQGNGVEVADLSLQTVNWNLFVARVPIRSHRD